MKEVRDAIYDSVNVHMRSDVPVGSFLSGGIDSSFIVSVAKEFHPSLKTFSVGFEQQGFSEVDVAKETAAALGIENISKVISPEEYMNELPKIVWHFDDPLADPAAIPLYFVAKEAKNMLRLLYQVKERMSSSADITFTVNLFRLNRLNGFRPA